MGCKCCVNVDKNPLYIPFRKELFLIPDNDPRYSKEKGLYNASSQDLSEEVQRMDEEAAAKDGMASQDMEVYRTLPCMHKNSERPYKRVKGVDTKNGKKRYVSYYEEDRLGSSDEEEVEESVEEPYDELRWEQSSEDDDDGKPAKWCTVRRNATLKTLGSALSYVKQPITR